MIDSESGKKFNKLLEKDPLMVPGMAKPKYKKSTIRLGCKKVDSQGELFTGIHDLWEDTNL